MNNGLLCRRLVLATHSTVICEVRFVSPLVLPHPTPSLHLACVGGRSSYCEIILQKSLHLFKVSSYHLADTRITSRRASGLLEQDLQTPYRSKRLAFE